MFRQHHKQGRVGPLALSVGPLAFIQLRVAGGNDGRRGLPRRDGNGGFASPFMARELEGLRQYCSKQWLRCERLSADMHIQEKELQNQMEQTRRILATYDAIKAHANAAKVPEPKKRKTGEEHLDIQIITQRRRRETQRLASGDFWQPSVSQQDASQQLDDLERELATVQESIRELERQTRLKCVYRENRANRRIAVYWNAAWRAALKHLVNANTLPPQPPLLSRSGEQVLEHGDGSCALISRDGEQVYLLDHQGVPSTEVA